MNSQPPFLFLTYFSSVNYDHIVNILFYIVNINIANIRGLHSNFVDCECFLESNSPDTLSLYETNLDD